MKLLFVFADTEKKVKKVPYICIIAPFKTILLQTVLHPSTTMRERQQSIKLVDSDVIFNGQIMQRTGDGIGGPCNLRQN